MGKGPWAMPLLTLPMLIYLELVDMNQFSATLTRAILKCNWNFWIYTPTLTTDR